MQRASGRSRRLSAAKDAAVHKKSGAKISIGGSGTFRAVFHVGFRQCHVDVSFSVFPSASFFVRENEEQNIPVNGHATTFLASSRGYKSQVCPICIEIFDGFRNAACRFR